MEPRPPKCGIAIQIVLVRGRAPVWTNSVVAHMKLPAQWQSVWHAQTCEQSDDASLTNENPEVTQTADRRDSNPHARTCWSVALPLSYDAL